MGAWRARGVRMPRMRWSPSRRRWLRWVRLVGKLALLGVVLWYVGSALAGALCGADGSQLTFRPGWLPAGLGLLAGGMLCVAAVYRGLYRRLGASLTLGESFALYAVPSLAAYLPGRGLALVGHAAVARSLGVPLAVGAPGVVLLTVLTLLAAVIVVLAALLVRPLPGLDPLWFRAALLAALALMVPVVHPRLCVRGLNRLLRLLRRPPLPLALGVREMAGLLAGLCAYVCLFISGYLLAVRAVVALPIAAMPTMIGAIGLATIGGVVTLFAPGGIGVREGLLLVFLSPLLGEPTAALTAVALRVVQVVVDALMAGAGAAMLHASRRRAGGDGGATRRRPGRPS